MNTMQVRWVVALTAAVLVAGCAGKMPWQRGESQSFPLQVSAQIPAATGEVKVTRGEGGNQNIEVRVEHLAPAERVVPGSVGYVVWLRPAGGESPQNLGLLSVSEDRKATFRAQTAFRQFEVFITAERSPNVTEPTKRELMTASVRVPVTL